MLYNRLIEIMEWVKINVCIFVNLNDLGMGLFCGVWIGDVIDEMNDFKVIKMELLFLV